MAPRDPRRPPNDYATTADGAAAVRAPVSDSNPSDPGPARASNPDDQLTVAPEVNPRASSSDAPTFVGGVSSSSAQAHVQIFAGGQPVLMPGAVLAKRYEIVQVLGEGGMGAVYKARDREVDRMVAIKVIRPDLAGNPAILDRFKQELVLSHQVTHRNVVRIYDLGDADGMKFITMEYIEGKDLRTVIQERHKLPPEESVDIMRQVCQALAAAHAVGVIHRDLKPQNIMLDAQGRVIVMDFGLARSLDSNGMTQSGALVGTFEYMSPEQGLGKHLDERSDLFTVGLIFYELLTGKMPYKADSALASLMKRTQERAVPISDLDGTIPRALSDIVAKCLEADLKKRYQTVEEILTDLEGWQGRHAAASLRFGGVDVWAQTMPWKWIGIGLAVVLLAAIAWLVHGRLTAPKAASGGPVVSVAVVPFRNASGDPSLDWLGASIADMLTTDMGQAASVRTVSADRLHQILRDLRITPDSGVDSDTLRRIAEFSSADQVISGQFARFGDQVRIDATLNDFKHQRSVPLKAEAPSQKELLAAVDQLAKSIQQNVAASPTVAKELVATSFTPSSKSMEAMRDFSQGTELARQGKHLDALKKFQASVQEDPQFAFAYAKLGQTYAKLGYDKDANAAARKAVDLADALPDAERYRIVAIQARIANDDQKAIDAYESLLKTSPNDVDLEFQLAEIYFASGAYPQARELYTKLLSRDPKYVDALLGISRVLILSGDSNAAVDYLSRAMSLAVQVSNDEQKAAALHLLGAAYSQLNKPQDAIQSFQDALEIERRVGDKRATAKTLDQMAPEQDLLGNSGEAFKSYQEALKLWKEIGDKRGAGSTGINLGLYYDTHGDYEKALAVTKDALQLEHEIGEPADEAQCLNNIGWFNLEMARYDDAMTYFQQALQLRQKLDSPSNVADSYYNLADTSTRVGQFDNALADYLKAVELWRKAGDKRGVAIASFGMGKLFEYQGRYGAAVSSMEDATKTLRDLQDRSLWMAEVLGGYGNALALIGRSDDAQKNLTEALSLARELKNDPLTARILGYQGDRLFYSGDYKGARPLYDQAQQQAAKTKDPYGMLIAKINAAKLAVKDGRSREAIGNLTNLRKQADSLRMKYLGAQCSLALGEALGGTKDYVHAQQELEDALHRAQDLGARTLVADAHYQLATTLGAKGNNGEAAQHLASARKIVDDIQQEAHSDQVLKRADLNPIYTASR